jgi:multiple sugar transport system permease protein
MKSKIAGYVTLGFFALVFLYPFVIQVTNAFKTEADAENHPLSPVPHPFDSTSFRHVFTGTNFPVWLGNSVLVTVVATIGRLLLDSMAGYALARLRFRGRRGVFATVLAMMAVPGVVLLIPKFLVLNQLGLYDTYGGLIIPLVADAAGVFIMKQFFESIPVSVEEAARIDGAGPFRTYWSVVLPMAKPALITWAADPVPAASEPDVGAGAAGQEDPGAVTGEPDAGAGAAGQEDPGGVAGEPDARARNVAAFRYLVVPLRVPARA